MADGGETNVTAGEDSGMQPAVQEQIVEQLPSLGERDAEAVEEPLDEDIVPKNKKRKTKQDEFYDMAADLIQRIPRVRGLREAIASASIEKDDMLEAAKLKQQLEDELAQFMELPVCARCWIEAPSPKSRGHLKALGLEVWRYKHHLLTCGQCHSLAGTHDGSHQHFSDAEQSLRRRVHSELLAAQNNLPDTCSDVMSKNLGAAVRELSLKVGQGRGKRKEKEAVTRGHLAAQIQRTLDQLRPEPNMARHRGALCLALQALEFR